MGRAPTSLATIGSLECSSCCGHSRSPYSSRLSIGSSESLLEKSLAALHKRSDPSSRVREEESGSATQTANYDHYSGRHQRLCRHSLEPSLMLRTSFYSP